MSFNFLIGWDSEFSVVAEFRVSQLGTLELGVLSYKGFKYDLKSYNPTKGTIIWHCTNARYRKCKARALTKEIRRNQMMKLIDQNHTHVPSYLVESMIKVK